MENIILFFKTEELAYLIKSFKFSLPCFPWKARKRYEKTKDSKEFFRHIFLAEFLPGNTKFSENQSAYERGGIIRKPTGAETLRTVR